MKTLTISAIIALTSFYGGFLFAAEQANATPVEISIIAGIKSPLPDKISINDIKEIYLGNKKLKDKVKLVPLNHKDKIIFDAFITKYLSMTTTAYKNYWVKKVFSGEGSAPKLMEKTEDVITFISQNEGAIGYIRSSDMKEKIESIKTISIEK